MKYGRREEILKIISSEEIQKQEELAEKLRERGYDVGQATVSRDIKALNLVKRAAPGGKLVYTELFSQNASMPEKLVPVFRNAFVSCDYACNMVVVRTLSGMANALASAVDSMEFGGILGSIAGDDTVLIVCRTDDIASEVCALLAKEAGSSADDARRRTGRE
ncbi:MAG: arginine repressor [Clostridia bacterium]|nr:arginine repressor [Clostridia bacterium]